MVTSTRVQPSRQHVKNNRKEVNGVQVQFTLNGETYNKTVKFGYAQLNIKKLNLTEGTYQIMAEYLGTSKYLASNGTGTLTVKPARTPTNVTV